MPTPTRTSPPSTPDDIADIAVQALTGGSIKGRPVTLTGAQSLTFRQQVAVLSEVLDRDISVMDITHAEAERQMRQYVPAPTVASLLALWAAASARPAAIADTTETLLGKPARTFRQWAYENATAFTRR